jgi:hypothetical protein
MTIAYFCALKMETAGSFEILLPLYQPTYYSISDDHEKHHEILWRSISIGGNTLRDVYGG